MTDGEFYAYTKGFELGYEVAIDEAKEAAIKILKRAKLHESFWQHNNAIDIAKIEVLNGLDKLLEERK